MGQLDKRLRLMIITDLVADQSEITKQLEGLNQSILTECATSEVAFREKIKQQWDIVIFMSHVSFIFPLAVLAEIKKTYPKLPFVMISSGISEEDVATLIKAGAEDVVIQSRLGRLTTVVKRIVHEANAKYRELEASLIAHEAIAAREQMLAIVSHDIRNPLGAIQLEAQMLLRVADRNGKSVISDDITVQANRILKTTERLKLLINDLLDRNKSENGLAQLNKAECDLIDLFQEVIEGNRALIRNKNIIIKSSINGIINLNIDRNKIFQAMNNLVGNAVKFAPEGGMIDLAIEESKDEFIFNITDNGPGLKESELKNIFEKYWTGGLTGRSGTGLGLFICKTIVEAHGGSVGGENVTSGGARFWFSLLKNQVEKKHDWIKDAKPKILVIDDDDDLREVISWALVEEGYSVQSYSDPREALESLRLGRHIPQLIVIDFQMDQMKGTDFLKRMWESALPHFKPCPVVMVSASPEEINMEEARHLCQEFMTKPLDLATLIKNVKLYL